MARPSSVLDTVDQFLGMFDTETDRKRFGRQRNPPLRQFPVGIGGGLTGCENEMARPDLFGIVYDNADKASPMDPKVGHARAETDLAAQTDQPLPEIDDNLPQAVRSDVRTGIHEDFGRRPHIHKNPLDPGGAGVF